MDAWWEVRERNVVEMHYTSICQRVHWCHFNNATVSNKRL